MTVATSWLEVLMTWTIPMLLGVAHVEFPAREPVVASIPPMAAPTTPRGLEAGRGARLTCRCGASFPFARAPKYCPSCSARLAPKG